MNDLQYIRTTHRLTYEELSGRYTILVEDVPGVILDEIRINELDATDKQKTECFRLLEEAQNTDRTLTLLQGRVCTLNKGDFYKCKAPVIYPVTNSIL